jgi:2-C-methyl-D-erythritol 4-phosphate cytidylyltransferase
MIGQKLVDWLVSKAFPSALVWVAPDESSAKISVPTPWASILDEAEASTVAGVPVQIVEGPL